MINDLRWHLFRVICDIGWWVCPQPHKASLQKQIPDWDELEVEQ